MISLWIALTFLVVFGCILWLVISGSGFSPRSADTGETARRADDASEVGGHGTGSISEKQMDELDPVAFRNLIDVQERRFLKEHLPSRQFRLVQRERVRVAILYVLCVLRQSRQLIKVGEFKAADKDPGIAKAGQEIIRSAIGTRMLALAALAQLGFQFFLPQVEVSLAGMLDTYTELRSRLRHLQRLQQPYRGSSAL